MDATEYCNTNNYCGTNRVFISFCLYNLCNREVVEQIEIYNVRSSHGTDNARAISENDIRVTIEKFKITQNMM